ncbi:MAG TPA: MAPEG family protein [SAR86 cluster bacterium]|jgi:hypothetical protein|nr:MAPEG family protein [SAR86 cluster bacterium]HJM14972.1 MAPEG family protein [SAR86 cluster bacterium]|tara:strand:+ start:97 stop:513 length:417 start_codon:yes stop_codon:yes gene_type:complete
MITLFYAGGLSILALFLGVKTGQKRHSKEGNITLGVGDNFELLQITRAHGNLIENVIFFLVLSALLEMIGEIPILAIYILGDIFLLSRISHAYGITRPGAESIFRMLGATGTFLVLATQSIWALKISISWLMLNNWGF